MHVATKPPITREGVPSPGRRIGYGVGAGINIALLMVVNSLVDWGWPAFLTSDFERLLPWINVSLIASLVVNLMFIAYDAAWFKSGWNVVLSAISLAVVTRTLQIFPFDFSDWSWPIETVARIVLVVVAVSLVIAIIAEGVKALAALLRATSS